MKDETTSGRDTTRPTPRSLAPSIRLAKTGAALLDGETVLAAAMVKGGYAATTARTPADHGVTVPRALAAAAATFPQARKTLRGLRPKAIEALDRALTLEEGERPDALVIQSAGATLKLAAEIGENDDGTEAIRSAAYYRRQTRRTALHAWLQGARYAAQHGLQSALERAVALSERTDERVSYLDAVLPPRAKRGPLQTVFQRKGP